MTSRCSRTRRTALAVVVLGVLAGCGSPDSVAEPTPEPDVTAPTTPSPTRSPDVTPSPPSPGPTGNVDPALATVVAQARTDLVGRLGVAEEAIAVVSAELVTWPDAGLGCRQPGRSYAQVTTDGSRVVLEHAGRQFAYHTGGRAAVPFYCEQPG